MKKPERPRPPPNAGPPDELEEPPNDFVPVPRWLLEEKADLPPGCTLILLHFCLVAWDQDSVTPRIGIDDLAEGAGLSVRSTRWCLAVLAREGFVRSEDDLWTLVARNPPHG